MARNKGTFPFAANFEVKAASPLDPRVLVERKAELISKDTWPLDGNTLYIYKGLLVSVQEENAIYMLVNPDKILSEDYSGWERKDGNQGGTSGGSIDVDLLHIIITVDRIEDIVNAQDNSISMSDDDVNAILNKKLIAAASPINGYVLADEVCYDDSVENPRKGFITFHYGNQNIKLAFDLTNKVYLGSESEITTIGEGGGNVEMHVISSIDSLQDAIAVGEDIWLDDEDINAILSNKQIATHTPYSGYIIATAVTLDDGKDWARIEFNYEGKLYSIYISINEACIVASESTITSLVNGGGSDSDLSDCLTKTEAEDTYLAQETFDEVIKRYATTEYVDEAINNIPQGGESYDDAEIKHDIENLKSGVSERNIKAIDIEGEEIEEPVIPGGGSGGSIDSEIIKQIQDTLDSHDELIEDLQNMKIDKENDDYYPNMSVGVADNLSGVDVVASEFTTRQSGGGAILDGTARIEAIKGNSIVWNQLATAPSLTGWGFPTSSVEAEILEKGEVYLKGLGVYALGSATVSPRIPLISGHTYLYSFDLKRSINERWGVYLGNNWWASSYTLSDPINAADTWIHVEQIATPSGELNRGLWIYPWNNTQLTEGEAWIKNVVVYDLTKMFGAGNEPETVDEFYQRLPIEVDPMLYNEGQMINLIPSGIKSYSADEEPIERFQDLSLIGTLFPDGMKSAGEFHDEIRYNKETQKWEKITRIGEVDLGSLNWSYARDIGYFYSAPSEDIGGGNTFKDINQQVVLINSVDFTGLHWSAFTNNYVDPRNNAISLFYTPDWNAVRANILCNEYTDAASFKEYLQGKKAYYVLNEPIVEELEFNGNLDYQVWNGGIEELVADNPSSALKADIAYGFNAHGKIKELEGRIDNLGGGGTGGSTITVDSALSDTSTNPVQNKIINAKFTELSTQVGGLSTAVESKQDKIADLETIRQGAAKGATALQSVPDTYATKTYVDEKVAQSGGGGGGEPSQYIKEATTSADGNTLTLTKKDNTQVVFSPNGGGGSSAPSDADRFVAGASPYLVWEDIYGKIHFERKSLETRRGQNDDDFRTTCKKIIAGSPIDINGNMAYLFSTQDSGKVAAVSEIYPYFLSEPSLTVAQYVFANMQNITDWSFIKHFDVSNCETLMGMFVQINANEIDISSWDVSKVKNMGGSNMFGFTKKVIGLENWNTSKVESFNLMFAYTQIGDLSGIKMWDVAKVTNFSNMFRGANNIQNLDISQWEIADGANMSAMLAYMEYLTSLGLCNVPHGCNTTQMVIGMTRLADVYMKEGAMIYASLDFKNSPLSATSIKALLSHLGDSPDEGATVTFSSNLYTTLSAEDKAEVDALRINAVEKGWSIVNMG